MPRRNGGTSGRARRPRHGRRPGRRPRRAARRGAAGDRGALGRRAGPVLAANEADMAAARADGIGGALLDRLRLDEARLEAIAAQLRTLAGVPAEPSRRTVRELPGGLRLDRAPQAGGRDRGQLRGPAERGGGHRLAVRQVAQRGRAADRLGGDPFGRRPGGRGHRARPGRRRARPGHDPAGPGARAGLRPGAGQPARPDPAGDPARQRGQHPLAGRRGGAARGAHDGARRRRRGPVRRRRRRPGHGGAADRGRPGPARRVQPAQPAAAAPFSVGRLRAARRGRCSAGWGSPRRCRRTPTPSVTSGRWTRATRRP